MSDFSLLESGVEDKTLIKECRLSPILISTIFLASSLGRVEAMSFFAFFFGAIRVGYRWRRAKLLLGSPPCFSRAYGGGVQEY